MNDNEQLTALRLKSELIRQSCEPALVPEVAGLLAGRVSENASPGAIQSVCSNFLTAHSEFLQTAPAPPEPGLESIVPNMPASDRAAICKQIDAALGELSGLSRRERDQSAGPDVDFSALKPGATPATLENARRNILRALKEG